MSENENQLETVVHWKDIKNYVWGAVLVLFGAAGGNVDRLYEQLPDVYGTANLKTEVKTLETKVENLEEIVVKFNVVIDGLNNSKTGTVKQAE